VPLEDCSRRVKEMYFLQFQDSSSPSCTTWTACVSQDEGTTILLNVSDNSAIGIKSYFRRPRIV
jgi:hypothetical protein